MKRLGSSDSLGAPISICPASEEKNSRASSIYSRGFPSVLDSLYEEDYSEECGHITEKKRRLTAEQVKALEKDFELENKLEPERKVKLAQELGLQPRQVAVWFQNRRARWKTKQLERDYAVLKSNYEALKISFDVLRHDKEAVLAELTELKSKRQQEAPKMERSIKEETPETIFSEQNPILEDKNQENQNLLTGVSMFNDFKDGSSDSDSSAILNEDHSPNGIQEPHDLFMMSSSLRFSCSTSMEAKASEDSQKTPLLSFMRMDEHGFLSSDEPCNFFNEEHAPTLPWLSPDPWN